jgi:hypothetical protein
MTKKTRLLLLPLPDEELTDEIEAGFPGAAPSTTASPTSR